MWQEHFVEAMVRRRRLVILIIGLISLVAGLFATKASFDSSIEIWFLENDPALVSYRNFLKRFGADEITVIGVFAEDVFKPDVLATLDRITKAAEKAPHAYRTRSLTNIRIFAWEEPPTDEGGDDEDAVGGGIAIDKLIKTLPKDLAAAADLRKRTLSNTLLVDNLVAKDGKAAAIVIELSPEGNTFEGKIEQLDAIREILAKEKHPGVTYRLGGSPTLDDAFLKASEEDMTLLAPLGAFLVILMTFVVFRRLSSAMIPLTVVLFASIWTVGLMGALGYKFNIVSSALISLLMAVGVADSIHVLAEYYRQLMNGEEREEAVRRTVAHLITPCFFTSITTAAGLAALLTSDLRPIREFGLMAAAGVLFAFALSITLVPAILQYVKPPPERFFERQREGRMAKLLVLMGRPTSAVRVFVVGISVALTVAGAYVIPDLKVGANALNYFREDAKIRVDSLAIDKALGGSTSVEFLVRTKKKGGLKEPKFLKRIDEFSRWIESLHGVTRSMSVLDSLKEVNRVLNGGKTSAAKLPTSRQMAAQYYLLLEGEDDFDKMVQEDYSVARLTARVSMTDSGYLAHELPAIAAELENRFNKDGLEFVMTGFIKLMSNMEIYLLDSQIRSFSVAFVVISLMMLLLLRSFRLTLFALIPNFLPVFWGLAAMVVLKIPLDPGTVMIGSIALGLVVDDTVHFLARLRMHLKGGAELSDAIARTMNETGRPIVITSVILAVSFAVLAFGNFAPNAHFGVVSALVIIFAVLADLILLPAALLMIRPKFSHKLNPEKPS
jgi:uncharacterized protein